MESKEQEFSFSDGYVCLGKILKLYKCLKVGKKT